MARPVATVVRRLSGVIAAPQRSKVAPTSRRSRRPLAVRNTARRAIHLGSRGNLAVSEQVAGLAELGARVRHGLDEVMLNDRAHSVEADRRACRQRRKCQRPHYGQRRYDDFASRTHGLTPACLSPHHAVGRARCRCCRDRWPKPRKPSCASSSIRRRLPPYSITQPTRDRPASSELRLYPAPRFHAHVLRRGDGTAARGQPGPA